MNDGDRILAGPEGHAILAREGGLWRMTDAYHFNGGRTTLTDDEVARFDPNDSDSPYFNRPVRYDRA